MKSKVQAVVIGGGVVGVSVLYHLAKLGWKDVVLVERKELTSGSTWHAAGGMHTLNGDVNMSYLQSYTVKLYAELEKESGQSCGVHRVGCLYVAGTEMRHDYLRSERAKARHLGLDLDFVSIAEAKKINPLMSTDELVAAVFDPNDGHVDPNGVTNAYAKAAKLRGAEIYLQTPVIELKPTPAGGWLVVTPNGTIETDVVINAAGLWAREVGRLAGVELPILPMEHQYIVTNNIAEVAALGHEIPMTIDFEGESYLRQEQKGLLIGTYEHKPLHWALGGTPPDFGHELLPPDLDRIAEAMETAMDRYPCLREGGIKRVINGGMVFAPDGNPIIGPVRGLKGYFCACGVMAGFSQGGGVGLAVAEWIVNGEPSVDVFAMDVSRFGAYANGAYVLTKTEENYRRRFAMLCPNEELEDARPLKTTPVYERFKAQGALFGANYGWEYPLWFAPEGQPAVETPSFRRSNAFGPVAEECRAVREAVGLWETSSYCKIEIAGPGAGNWLDGVVANKLPAVGRANLVPLLSRGGKMLGDMTATCLAPDRYLLIGSPAAALYYCRWFESLEPPARVAIRDVTADWCGFSISGPKARELMAQVTRADVSAAGFKFLDAKRIAVGLADCLAMRISFTGELGWELYMPPESQLHVYEALTKAGAPLGLKPFGARALNSLRLEKGYGAWSREYSMDYGVVEAGMEKLVRLEKAVFVGKAPAARDLSAPPKRKLTILEIQSKDLDPLGGEPILEPGAKTAIGRVTSGGYGHYVGKSIALSYLPADLAVAGRRLEIEILGERFPAIVCAAPHYDPNGGKMRS